MCWLPVPGPHVGTGTGSAAGPGLSRDAVQDSHVGMGRRLARAGMALSLGRLHVEAPAAGMAPRVGGAFMWRLRHFHVEKSKIVVVVLGYSLAQTWHCIILSFANRPQYAASRLKLASA